MLKRILRYLAGTRSHGIIYRKSYRPTLPLIGYTDAAFGNADEKKSTTGLVFLSAGGAILWKSKKQTIIALSTTEAEYIALAHIGTEARWLRNLYNKLQLDPHLPIPIRTDSLGADGMASNPYITQKSRHIDLKYHSARQLIKLQIIKLETIRNAEQTADVLTKVLPRPKHKQHVGEMGIAPV